jgi:predicted CoA-substrate-specific enzyme activase
VRGFFSGIDVGTSYIKVVLIDENGSVVGHTIERSGSDLQSSIDTAFQNLLETCAADRDSIAHITATGFGRKNVTFADSIKTEIACHARGAYHHFPQQITVIDIGGQDTKVIKLDSNGKRTGFKMNRKCAAGTGTFLEEIAGKLQIEMDRMNELASRSENDVALSSFCTVFASSEILTRIREGENLEDMVKSAYESVARRVIEMDTLEGPVVMTGGVVAHNDIMIEMMKKYIRGEVLIPPKAQMCGAFGASLFASEN